MKDSTGTGDDQVLFQPPFSNDSPVQMSTQDWSADNKYILAGASLLPVAGERKRIDLSAYTGANASMSPDGQWLAYHTNQSGGLEVFVQSLPELMAGRSSGKWQISTGGGSDPEWRKDSKELFYVAADNRLMAVSIKAIGTALEAGLPQALFPVRIEAINRRAHYQAASNGQRFLVVQLLEQTTTPITTVLNWLPAK